MNRAYFEVGEEVILQSKKMPEFNGQVLTIDKVKHGKMRELTTGGIYYGYYYSCIPDLTGGHWGQPALKKKHKPGEDFRTLMYQWNNELVEEI